MTAAARDEHSSAQGASPLAIGLPTLSPLELTLTRNVFGEEATLGGLDLDGAPFCYTLEDQVRVDPDPSTPQNEAKVYGKTAIPAGRYKVDFTYSPKFNKIMLAVLDVPGFTGIRIHSGNDADDTLGCILVGAYIDSPTRIHGGSVVLPVLQRKVQEAFDEGRSCHLTITQNQETHVN